MNEEEILLKIDDLKSQLSGDLFADGHLQQSIYELKLQLKPEIENEPELDDDDECLSCGA